MNEGARLIRALLTLGIPYTEAIQLPIDIAIAILTDERPNNTHQKNPRKSRVENSQSGTSGTGTTYVAAKRKHSKPKV